MFYSLYIGVEDLSIYLEERGLELNILSCLNNQISSIPFTSSITTASTVPVSQAGAVVTHQASSHLRLRVASVGQPVDDGSILPTQ